MFAHDDPKTPEEFLDEFIEWLEEDELRKEDFVADYKMKHEDDEDEDPDLEKVVKALYQEDVVDKFRNFQKVEISTITFLYRNRAVIEKLRHRAKAQDIYGRYQAENDLNETIKDEENFKVFNTPVSAIVSFQTQEAAERLG